MATTRLSSLIGNTIAGATGPTGATGITGATGVTGATGANANLTAGTYVVRAKQSGTLQTIAAGSDTVVALVDDFDPNNWWSSNKFQPNVEGYYNIDAQVWWEAGSVNNNQTNIQLRKNGTTQIIIDQRPISNTGIGYAQSFSTIHYFNGSSDYVELTAYTGNPTSQNIAGAASGTWFSAALYAYGTPGATGPTGATGVTGATGSPSPWTANGSNAYYTTGNVSIGTTSVGDSLTVLGRVQIQQNSSSSNRLVFRAVPGQSYRWSLDNDSVNDFRLFRENDSDATSGSVYLKMTPAGTLDLPYGQIKFPGSQNASSDANTLDDYEEGTYTPTITVSSGTPNYSYQQGYYTKIGRQVFGGGIIGVTNNNTLLGEFRVTLPFTASAGNYGYTGGFVSDGTGFTWPVTQGGVSFYSIYLQAQPGVANLAFVGVGTTAKQINYNDGGIGTSWYFRFSFSFYV